MTKACIAAVSYHLPDKVETNNELIDEMQLSWSDDDIFQKTGIKQRHVVTDECASDLGEAAARKLFASYSDLLDKIDYLIFCSQSPDYTLPATACILQERLGLKNSCAAMDINQGCSGFIYGVSTAKALIETGIATNVLLITAETYSKYMDKMDKSTRTIFGDGAAATWITGCDSETDKITGIVLGTNGAGRNNLIVPNSGARKDEVASNHLFMDGPEIFQFTLLTIPKMVKEILSKVEMGIDDIDYFIFHQANAFILEHLRKKLKIPADKFCVDMEKIGNTVSASIPIVLKRAMDRNEICSGMKVMLVGFGVGYSWGGCVVEI